GTGGSARHRLEYRQAEALVHRRIEDAERAAVLPRELIVVDRPEPRDVGATRRDATPAQRTDHAEVDTELGSRLDCACEVFPRLERADGQDVLAVGARPSGRERVVDGVWHDVDPLAWNTEKRLELGGRELGNGDHAVRAAQDAWHDHRRIRARPARKRVGMPK